PGRSPGSVQGHREEWCTWYPPVVSSTHSRMAASPRPERNPLFRPGCRHTELPSASVPSSPNASCRTDPPRTYPRSANPCIPGFFQDGTYSWHYFLLVGLENWEAQVPRLHLNQSPSRIASAA